MQKGVDRRLEQIKREQAIFNAGYRKGYRAGYERAGGVWVAQELEAEEDDSLLPLVGMEAEDEELLELLGDKWRQIKGELRKLQKERAEALGKVDMLRHELEVAKQLIGKGTRQAIATDALVGIPGRTQEQRIEDVKDFFRRKGVLLSERHFSGEGDAPPVDENEDKVEIGPIFDDLAEKSFRFSGGS